MYYYRDVGSGRRAMLVHISIGIAFVKFCGIIVWSILHVLMSKSKCKQQSILLHSDVNIVDSKETNTISRGEVSIQDSCQFRDSILEDAPLFDKKLATY